MLFKDPRETANAQSSKVDHTPESQKVNVWGRESAVVEFPEKVRGLVVPSNEERWNGSQF